MVWPSVLLWPLYSGERGARYPHVSRRIGCKAAQLDFIMRGRFPAKEIPMTEPIGFDPARLQQAYALLQRWTDGDRLPAATLCVGRRGQVVAPRFFGRRAPEATAPPLGSDALFLVASITKPVTV